MKIVVFTSYVVVFVVIRGPIAIGHIEFCSYDGLVPMRITAIVVCLNSASASGNIQLNVSHLIFLNEILVEMT